MFFVDFTIAVLANEALSGVDSRFHGNRSCRLLPAHQGVKTRSCDLVWRVGTVDSATPQRYNPLSGDKPLCDSGFSFRQ